MEYCYEFAGVRLSVCGSESMLYSDHGVLAPFLSSQYIDVDHRSTFELVDQISPAQGVCIHRDTGIQVYHLDDAVIRYAGTMGSSHMRIERRGSESIVTCLRSAYPNGITPKTVLNAIEAEHLIVHNGGFILHASFIQVGERAILFTAPSGTGKSTQADLWCRFQKAELINGDRAAVMMKNGRVIACGIPYSGSSGVAINTKLPVAAIVYLNQALSNSVEELHGFRAFRKVWEGCSVNAWDKDDVSRASDTLLSVLNSVPVFHLSCKPDQTAVDVLAYVLAQRGHL